MANELFSISDIHEDVLHTADKYMKKVLINAKHRFYRVLRKHNPNGYPHYELERCSSVLAYEEPGFLFADSETFDLGEERICLERSELTEALLSLSKRQLDIILQLVFLKKTQEQIATELGISTRMIRKHRDLAFAKLRRLLTDEKQK